jgi:hypothetical protein
MTLDEMVTRGELERVEPDGDGARAALDEARRHVESATEIGARDPNGAYQLAYDAARKAVVADLRRRGYRVRRGEGGHLLTAEYARTALDDGLGRRLEAMRRRRNRSEYGTTFIGAAELDDACEVARALIDAAER